MGTAWTRCTVGDLGKVVTGRTPPSASPELFGAAFPFITPTDLTDDGRRARSARWLSEEGARRQAGVMLPANSVCVTCIASIGKMCLTERPSFTNQQINALIVDSTKHDPLFVYYMLRTKCPDLRRIAGGAATPIVNKSTFSSVVVDVPSLAIQRTVGSVLGTYDDLIENNARRIKLLDEMARTLYREWFVEFRFPGYRHGTGARKSAGRPPEGWLEIPLFDLADVTYGFPFKSKLFTAGGKGIPVVRIRDLSEGQTETHTSEPFAEKYWVEDGDLLIGMDGLFHMCRWASGRAALNQRVVRLRARTTSQFFLALALAGPIKHLEETITGTTVAHLSDKDLRGLSLLVAPTEIQERFDDHMDGLFWQVITLRKKNANLRATRDLILPRLISGEIDVSDLPLPSAA